MGDMPMMLVCFGVRCAQVLSSDPPPLSWNVQNIFPLGVVIHERYDLKGSWVNRSSNVGSNAVVKQCR
jgi:hypothetical protein